MTDLAGVDGTTEGGELGDVLHAGHGHYTWIELTVVCGCREGSLGREMESERARGRERGLGVSWGRIRELPEVREGRGSAAGRRRAARRRGAWRSEERL